MSQNAAKTFIVTRSDGILLARYRDRDWYLTTDLTRPAVVRSRRTGCAAKHHSRLRTVSLDIATHPEKEGISC